MISEVHAGDGFQFWNIIDFHTLPCVNAKFYKFRNDSFDLSTGMHIKEYAQFVTTVNGFLDLWFDQGTPYIRGEEHVVLGTPVIMEHQNIRFVIFDDFFHEFDLPFHISVEEFFNLFRICQ